MNSWKEITLHAYINLAVLLDRGCGKLYFEAQDPQCGLMHAKVGSRQQRDGSSSDERATRARGDFVLQKH